MMRVAEFVGKFSWRRLAFIGFVVGVGLALSGCDKCGNSIFRTNSCGDMQPRQ